MAGFCGTPKHLRQGRSNLDICCGNGIKVACNIDSLVEHVNNPQLHRRHL